MTTANETINLRRMIAILRGTLGVILLVTWWENLQKGLYQPQNFADFINWLADGHPIGFYQGFLAGVVAPNAGLFGMFQLITELGMAIALIIGAFTPAAGLGATFFFLNLFMAYLNPNLHEWIWTYVLLVATALVVTISRSGRAWGVDEYLAKNQEKLPFSLGKFPLSLLW